MNPNSRAITFSICVPTFNRSHVLGNCLDSIARSLSLVSFETAWEVVVLDNASLDATLSVIESFRSRIKNLRLVRKTQNGGVIRNIVDAISYAKGKYVWLVGDDDIVAPRACSEISRLVQSQPEVAGIFVNAWNDFYATYSEMGYDRYWATIGHRGVPKFCENSLEKVNTYIELCDPDLSFDLMGGMFLLVFDKTGFDKLEVKFRNLISNNSEIFPDLFNTFPHTCIWNELLKDSPVVHSNFPLIASMQGEREWSAYYLMIRSIRIPELLILYNHTRSLLGMNLLSPQRVLKNFWLDLLRILFLSKNRGLRVCDLFFILRSYKFSIWLWIFFVRLPLDFGLTASSFIRRRLND